VPVAGPVPGELVSAALAAALVHSGVPGDPALDGEDQAPVSIQAIAWTLERSELPLVDRMVLTVYAYHADELGSSSFPSIATVAEEAGAGRSTVKRARGRLVDAGHLVQIGTRPSGTPVFRLPMRSEGSRAGQGPVADPLPAEGGPERATPRSAPDPDPSVEPSREVPPVVPQLEVVGADEVAALNGSTPAVIERFRLAAKQRPDGSPLLVDVPALIRALEDYSHVPDLKREALSCAEWLLGPRGRKRKDAARVLRSWLERRAKEIPNREEPRGRYTHVRN
jgi:hypothetical protein